MDEKEKREQLKRVPMRKLLAAIKQDLRRNLEKSKELRKASAELVNRPRKPKKK